MSVVYRVFILLMNLVALCYTAQIRSLLEIPVLHKNNTFIKNDQYLLEKLNKIIQGGCDNLQIVTDFDLTLTADSEDNGKTVLNSYEMLRLCPSVPQTYKDEDEKLYNTYKPIEGDPNLSIEEKSKFMVEWYKASRNLLRGLRYPRNELKELALNASNCFRETVHDLINWSKANDVPILVLSSGLGDAVAATLESANLLTQNVKILSNFLELDSEDKITGMKGEPIHSFNKNEASVKNTDYYETLKTRTNVILMGDSIGDANMAEGMDHCDTVIKIGFLNKNKRDQLQTYLNHFDIVLENDQTMNVVNSIVNLL